MRETILWQRAEGALLFAAALALFWLTGPAIPWWAALAAFFAPDLSFAAYLAGARAGAFAYNLVHVYALGGVVYAAGAALASPETAAVGALLLGHSGFDRMLGYGLKTHAGFRFTHLGRIGR
ncbi:DUF4260 family protein [Camelimonas abortus]|uniref:DUF4260 family protein n=1 Tax=Camelimonas abortus TaxID=1017184 RepID=A0ABV7LC11_9HYPH